MKKAKIVLSAIALLAVVGGALAFKANKFSPNPLRSYLGTLTTITTQTVVNGPVYSTTAFSCAVADGFFTTIDNGTEDIVTYYSTSTTKQFFLGVNPTVTTTTYCTSGIGYVTLQP